MSEETCADCGAEITETRFRDGTVWSSELLASRGQRKYDRVLCLQHFRLANDARRKASHIESQAWEVE